MAIMSKRAKLAHVHLVESGAKHYSSKTHRLIKKPANTDFSAKGTHPKQHEP